MTRPKRTLSGSNNAPTPPRSDTELQDGPQKDADRDLGTVIRQRAHAERRVSGVPNRRLRQRRLSRRW
jgi:hypothetical protein